MKNLLLLVVVIFIALKSANAQVPKAMPSDANEFYNKSMPLLRPQVKNIVLQIAATLKSQSINTDSLSNALQKNYQLKGMGKNDIDGIAVLIMVQASSDADSDLKKMVLAIGRGNDKKNVTSKDNSSVAQNLKLQTIMDCKSDFAEGVTYVMKKISGTQQDIINNLK